MDLSQRQNIVQTMRQEQTMTHQQIQALELLFLPVLELQAMIDSEIEKNPVLSTDLDAGDDVPKEVSGDADEWLDNIIKLDDDCRYIRGSVAKYSKDDEERRQHYLDSVVSEETFQQTLLDQLRFRDIDDRLRSCCEVVISGLDDDGYLTTHPADLAMASGQTLEVVDKALKIVQRFEPPGVAASDLRERLLIQLDRKGLKDTPVYILVRDFLGEMASNHLPQVARKMGISIDILKELIAEVQNLSPRLISESVSPHEYIHEEVVIVEEGGDIKVKINNEYLPNLFISKSYKKLLADPATPKETKDYIKEKLRSGVFLINSIIQRQTTIRRIVNAIIEYQRDFFIVGMDTLKPMTMAKIAERIGIHETTVSRAVAGKHMKCKYGLLPLRHFFSTGYESEDGRSVSKNVVKNAIRALIDREDTQSPLSDSRIVEKLKQQGYKVARRTVAKYRESMNILPSNLRRQY